MKKYTKIIAAVMAVALLSAFTDVPKKHWAYDYVTRAQQLKIVEGVSEKIFKPDDIITKQEVAYLIVNVLERSTAISDETFNECVSSSAVTLTQAQIASWASSKLSYGFVNEFWKVTDFQVKVNGKNGGSSILTRQMMSRWICNAMGYKTFGLRVIDYADRAEIDPAYYAYVDSLKRYGIMTGSNGNFQPSDSMTRAQAAGVAVNMCDKTGTTQLESSPFVFEAGTVTNVNSQVKSFVMGDKIYQIADEAKILLDGKVVSFDEISKLKDKKITASLYLAGDNVNSVVIQTKPVSMVGTLDEIYSSSVPNVKNSSYKVASILVDGAKVDFVINSDTEVLSSLNIGSTVQFITDGIYVLEIE